jgi:hypothetical protein
MLAAGGHRDLSTTPRCGELPGHAGVIGGQAQSVHRLQPLCGKRRSMDRSTTRPIDGASDLMVG